MRAGKDALLLTRHYVNTQRQHSRAQSIVCALWSTALLLIVVLTTCGQAAADTLELPTDNLRGAITVDAQSANRWWQGAYEVWLLRGNCVIAQGRSFARGDEAVVWIERDADGTGINKLIVYTEGNSEVVIEGSTGANRVTDHDWFGRFTTGYQVQVRVANPGAEPKIKPAVYESALARRDPYHRAAVQRTQFTQFDADTPQVDPIPAGARRLRAFPRSSVPVNVRWFPGPSGTEWIAVIDSGVNLIIDGVDELGSVDILTDRMVIWTTGLEQPDLTGQSLQGQETPIEIYLEGNIVFRQGERIIHAQRMFYNVNTEVGTVLDAEILTPVPAYQGLLRLKADVIQQTGRNQFYAERGFITSSRFGAPRYRLQSQQIFFEDTQTPVIDPFTGAQALDPVSGEPLVDHKSLATAKNNFLFLGPVPVFYWPRFATDVNDPALFLERIAVRNDQIFGTQILADFNAYELLGIQNRPEGTKWDISTDYLSDRGPAGGTSFRYNRAGSFFGGPTSYAGFLDAWAIQDHGNDNLGATRMDIPPDKDFRYRLLWRHREYFENSFRLTAEAGWISDRNFLEQYFENEWDDFKDESTGVELKQLRDTASWSITADTRINDFVTTTEWLPRGDYFNLGRSLFGDRLTWTQHSSAGYAQYRTASFPDDPTLAAVFVPLPWDITAAGERIATRHGLELPVPVGPVKFVPYAVGELAHWGEDISGNSLQRAYGAAGLRASLPMWSAYPMVENNLLNVHGLAHKVVFGADLTFADANQDMTDLQLYDAIDDDNIEAFTRRFTTFDFAGAIPPSFDPRFYALRNGIANYVTSPTTEIADDLATVRLDVEQRWQTKRGPPGRQRIIDWVILDTGAVIFPDATRDNFGEDLGLVHYDFRWHVGDKFTLLSGGLFDFFADGQRIVTMGGYLNRPPRGAVSLQFRLLDGPITSTALIASYSYLLSPKWISTAGALVDFENDTQTQNLSITRIGESLLVSAGINGNSTKDVVGVSFSIEPRFLPGGRTVGAGGAQIPPAGLFGLE